MPGKETITTEVSSGAEGLRKSTKREEHKVESQKGGDLKKGSERFEERSESSDGKGAGAKQGSPEDTVTTRETRS
jgi:hypothetical protein